MNANESLPSNLSMKKETESVGHHPIPVSAPIDQLGPAGLAIRRFLLNQILAGTPALLQIEKLRTPWRTSVMKVFSFFGLEDFFTPMIIVFLWVIDTRFGIMFTLLLGCGFYIASFFKCLFCLPRPPKPPVNPVTDENKDWAFPSNHSIMGVIMPWFIWCYTQANYHRLSTLVTMVIVFFLVTWSLGVMMSRLYLGVHSLVDLAFGVLAGAILLTVFDASYERIYDLYEECNRWFFFTIIATHLFLLYIHPRSWPETQSFGESVITTSSAMGMLAGRAFGIGPLPALALLQQAPVNWVIANVVSMSLARIVTGMVVLLLFRILAKHTFRMTFLRLMKIMGLKGYSFSVFAKLNPQRIKHYTKEYAIPDSPYQEREVKDPKNGFLSSSKNMDLIDHWDSLPPSERPYDVDIPVRYVVYSCMGWLATEGCPALFSYLGI